jgi:antitoxin component YwqK of YwqJK toxin-antitoxin module
MKKRLLVLIMALRVVLAPSCFSQTNSVKNYLKENFTTIDSSCKNEMDLSCNVYRSKIRNGLFMQICYWDSLKTKIASKHFRENGKYNGPCHYWAPGGYLTMKGAYTNDKKNGKWYYYLGKKISSEGEYKDGKKIRIWKEYDQDGRLKKEINYGNK